MKYQLKLLSAGVAFFIGSETYFSQAKQDTLKTQNIEGIVVTALGIKREKRSLGYSTQEVKGEDINRTPTTNFLNNLSGKVAGLEIRQSTNFGGSVDAVSRGYKSILGDNQALFIVDGVPIINRNINTTSQLNGFSGYDYGSPVSDINPNDIETVNVLKGAAATALYGSRAQNGAIIITTKKGKKNTQGIGLEYSGSISVSTIDRSTFPEYQTQYGQGYAGNVFQEYNNAPFVHTFQDASYGAPYDPNLMVWQYDAFIPDSQNFGKKTPWVMAKNGPITFFEKAFNRTNNIALNGGNDRTTFRLSYSNTYATDIMPNSSLSKNNFGGNASYKITDNLTATIFANYIVQSTKGRNTTGYGDNIMGNFRQWWPTNVDLQYQKYLYDTFSKNYTWNIKSPVNLSPAYWDNPYFTRYENYQNDKRERFAGNFSLSYDLSKKINILGRVGIDGYSMILEERRAVGSVPAFFSSNIIEQPSGYAVTNLRFTETNYDLIATYKDNITEDLSIQALAGANINAQSSYSNAQTTTGGLYIPGLYTISNSVASPARPIITDTSKYIYGAFIQASLGYQNTYYLEGTFRRDQSTALPKANNAYYYPSVSASVVFSNLLKQQWLSFGKLRAAYAEVGSDTAADQLRNRFIVQTSFGNIPVYSYNTTLRNADLLPQKLKNFEIGTNMQFFKNRVGIDLSWFRNIAFDQILPLPVSLSTGSGAKIQNTGELTTKGVELSLNLTPLKFKDFSWDLLLNWSNPKTRVTALREGIENITIGALQGGISINASLNEDYGSIWGSDYVYDPNGNKIVGRNGAYLHTDDSNHNFGSFQPDFIAGLNNSFTYKNFNLSFQIDWKKGGKIFSLDQYYGTGTGLYPETVGLNDLGNPVRNTLANGGGVILPGVMQDPNNPGHYIPNTIRLDRSISSQYLGTDPPTAAFIYDASFIKLRQVSVSYTFNKNFLKNSGIQGLTVGFTGSNLWIIHKNLPYSDPEAGISSGSIQGYQSGVMPSTRNFAFNLKVNF
ncbi:SusC/RagA family TonB-linked outer membrane protein [Chryseobacterium arthrosphaerae]|uniref:SusC/RagA family TonB-linked outer membrane protein n=1 Tax=Chryseobacterium arthrosphaerae TaxID=651561 RepID=UPI000F4F2CFF|nr:SusC/RagA family TonB-linked outer membrane protein [Chryseobacterium arthrosphaerae]AYZ12134.1 SusC/RagA family TonB-linked outer membrane protein [Chryseobacterium arthrosphaerae]UEQ77410.1 SusC/RagA family TonB-linked outer membrane protein [Chryseobacterium arthrosphaerae]